MNTRYYGPIKAEIDHRQKTITLTYKRGRGALSDGSLAKVRGWARSQLKPLVRKGYELSDLVRS